MRKTGLDGFTLVECLVVVAIIVVLVIVFGPALIGSHHGNGTTIMNNGRNIYVSLFAHALDPDDPSPIWPQMKGEVDVAEGAATFPDSTEFFKWMVTAEVMNVDFSFFSAPKMESERSTNASRFTSAHNAWAITLGLNEDTPDGTPVLFTANLSQDSDSFSPLRFVDEVPYLAKDAKPFGDIGGIVVFNGGAAKTVKEHTLTAESFNQPGATNQCLYPSEP